MALGYAVTGVDMSKDLLDELARFKGAQGFAPNSSVDSFPSHTKYTHAPPQPNGRRPPGTGA